MKQTFGIFAAAALTLAVALETCGAADAKADASRFALLPLVAGDTGIPYAIFPTPAERAALGGRLQNEVVAMNGGAAIDPPAVERAIAKAGYDQNSSYRSCDDADCARRVGRALHADTVLFGSVTRYMAMIWGTEVSMVDVATGAVQGPYSLGYKGDYTTLSTGVDALAQSVSHTLVADAAARNRAHTMASTHH